MLRDTPNNESIIVEYGFVDSKGDDVNQIKNNYKAYAEAVVRAVSDYIGVPYFTASGNTYIVKKGDSLWGIAKEFNTTVNELKSLNNLTSNTLQIGQILMIKPNVSDNITYTVSKGDNLYSIANKYNTSINDIKTLNNLKTDILQIGQVLKIPNNYINYIVKKGDSLYSISKEYNTTISLLKRINNLSSDILQINQKLLVPSK